MIFALSGGGGSALQVRAAATEPGRSEGTIWLTQGQPVTSWDISASQPRRRSGTRNLICSPYYSGEAYTSNGIEWTASVNGRLRAVGTATATSYYWLSREGADNGEMLLEPGEYTLSGSTGGSAATYALQLAYSYDNWTTTKYLTCGTAPNRVTLDYRARARVFAQVTAGTTVAQDFAPQLELGNTASDYIRGSAEGQVWIEAAVTGPEINALSRNGVWAKLSRLWQHVESAWVLTPGKLYQGGAWVDIVNGLTLFGEGADNASVTGGWTAFGDGAPTASIEGGKLVFANKAEIEARNGQWWMGPVNKQDLTGYSLLRVQADILSGPGYLVVTDAPSWAAGTNNALNKIPISSAGGQIDLDISAIDGERYVGFIAYEPTTESHRYSFASWELL